MLLPITQPRLAMFNISYLTEEEKKWKEEMSPGSRDTPKDFESSCKQCKSRAQERGGEGEGEGV